MLGTVPPRTFKNKTFPGLLLCAAAMLGAAGAGCADESGDSDADLADGDTQDLALEQEPASAASPVRFVSVTANGTGCPRGSWRGTVARDGSTVSLRFSSFTGEVGRNSRINVKDCQLAIKLGGTESVSVALADIRTSGRAYLRGSSNLTVTSSAYWQGNPADKIETSVSLNASDSFTLGEAIPEHARIWSPCGKQRDLNVATRARLNSTDNSYGWFEISRIGEVKLAVKRCGDAQPDGSVETDAGTPDGSVEPDAGTDSGVPDAGEPDSSVPPTGAVVTRVVANGTGCPAGTATPTIAPDGKSFTVAFTQFTGSVDENTAIAVKDCNLGVSVSAPEGQSFALQSLNLKGSGKLGEGANVNLTTSYYFMGNPTVNAQQQTTLTGPYDQAFDLTHAYGDAAPASPCGLERDLNAVLRFRLQNGTPRTASTFTVNSAGDAAFRLVPCQ